MPNINEVLAVILGGGRGTRLFPLTQQRSKPAVPIAGKYRLIDIPISNCINSKIYKIAVLTQFNSVSLHRHISNTYQFDNFHSGWVQIWAAEQTTETNDWYQGTADAVRKQLFEIRSSNCQYILILAGDHLYRMDYEAMAQFHWETQADITVAVQPVKTGDTGRFGILKRDKNMQITHFAEKPTDPNILQELVSREDKDRPYLGSMGIYIFNVDLLDSLLQEHTFADFGSHVIPHAIHNHHVFGFDFDDFWEDIGTIRSFYDTNLMLARQNPPFDLYSHKRPIYTHPRYLPGSSIQDSELEHVLLSEGCLIENANIRNSVIGLRSRIGSGSRIEDSIIMGADYIDPIVEPSPAEFIPIGIGDGSIITGCIVDKNARIGRGVTILPFPRGTDINGNNWYARDGIIVIPKNAVIPNGTYIGPNRIAQS